MLVADRRDGESPLLPPAEVERDDVAWARGDEHSVRRDRTRRVGARYAYVPLNFTSTVKRFQTILAVSDDVQFTERDASGPPVGLSWKRGCWIETRGMVV